MRLKAKRDRHAEDKFVYEQGQENGIKIGREDGIKIGQEHERKKNIKVLIRSMRSLGAANEQIVNVLMKEYELSKEEAEEKLQ